MISVLRDAIASVAPMVLLRRLQDDGQSDRKDAGAHGWKPWRMRHSPGARVELYENLADMLSAGIIEKEALDLLWRALSENGTERGRPAACAVDAWRTALDRSQRFQDAVRGWVPPAEQMLFAGRSEGRRVEALRQAAELAKQAGRLRKAIVGNMIYPCVLISLAVWLVWLLGVKVIPVLADTRPGGWKGAGGQLVMASNLLRGWGWVGLLGLAGGGIAISVSLGRWVAFPRLMFDKYLPPWSIYRTVQECSVLLACAAQMQVGVPIDEALAELGRLGSPWLRHRVHAIVNHIQGGETLADAMEMAGNQFPTGEVIGQIGIFERTGNLAQNMPVLARNRVERAIGRVESQMNAINLLLMLAVGMTVVGVGAGIVDLMDQTTSMVR